jgi:hypothetical protein
MGFVVDHDLPANLGVLREQRQHPVLLAILLQDQHHLHVEMGDIPGAERKHTLALPELVEARQSDAQHGDTRSGVWGNHHGNTRLDYNGACTTPTFTSAAMLETPAATARAKLVA